MRAFNKLIPLLLLPAVIFFVLIMFPKSASAQVPQPSTPPPTTIPTVDPGQSGPPEVSDQPDYTTNPPLEQINEGASPNYVEVTFHNLPSNGEGYSVCTGDSDCLKDSGFSFPANSFLSKIIEKTSLKADENGDVGPIKVCGDGKSNLKIDCGPNDYFWGGSAYTLSLGNYSKSGDNITYRPVKTAGFYVGHTYPTVKVNPSVGITPEDNLTVSILNDAYRPGGFKRNNYQVVLKGGSVNEGMCVGFSNDKSATTGVNFGKLTPGKYTITIKEMVNDDDLSLKLKAMSKGAGLIPAVDNPEGENCDGSFTYYQMVCEVADKDGKRCYGVDESGVANIKDPNSEEYKQFTKALINLSKSVFIALPCGDGSIASQSGGTPCREINTAIGPIQVTVQGFITSLFDYVLAIAGLAGIVIIVYAGYVFMTSRGDKEKIAGARETLTSAVVGLLFIILSIVILEIIGIDILRIPGFK